MDILIQMIVVLLVVGVMLWAVNAYLPLAQPIKGIVNLIVIFAVCLWVLNVFFFHHRFHLGS